MAGKLDLAQRSKIKQVLGEHDEMRQPLAIYRHEERTQINLDFYSIHLRYHMAQHHFSFASHTPEHPATWRCIAR